MCGGFFPLVVTESGFLLLILNLFFIFAGLLDMLVGLLTAYRPQSVPVVVHVSLVKSSMRQKSRSCQLMHICVGNRILIRELISTADIKTCSVMFLSHK